MSGDAWLDRIVTDTQRFIRESKQRAEFRKRVFRQDPDAHYLKLQAHRKEQLKITGGMCAICGMRPKKLIVLDHCHTTNKVRGVLCNSCNTALGMFRDSPKILIAAARYVRKWKREHEYGGLPYRPTNK